MEVLLYNSTVCRLCGEENDSGTLLYSCEENSQNLCDVINTYLPIKVSDDGVLPRTICPGCTIQLEATVEFFNLIISGQKVIRELHQREKEYKKSLQKDEDDITKKIVYEINTSDGVYQLEHPISLQVAGLERPKRKRGRPPKKPKTPEELAEEAAARERELREREESKKEDVSGKRRRKTPTRFKGAVQGKELERIFKEEGVTEGSSDEAETAAQTPRVPREPEVIGHLQQSGEAVLLVRGKGRGRPKGRMQPTLNECAICGMEFSSSGRYMSHIAQHGPVEFQCAACEHSFTARLELEAHQRETGHAGRNVLPCARDLVMNNAEVKTESRTPTHQNTEPVDRDPLEGLGDLPEPAKEASSSDPDLSVQVKKVKNETNTEELAVVENSDNAPPDQPTERPDASGTKERVKLKCNHCDKLFSTKQSKSIHIKAVHCGEKPYVCGECGCRFAYPRSLALHRASHRRRQRPRRYACDLCPKVLNHPSSVVYHKEAEHAGQRYVCNKCSKPFKHKQLLRRHQLVHTQARPFECPECGATFKTKANLVNHQLLHSGVKKFTCDICQYRFAHKTSLTLHMRWHTGSKPYVCRVCGKGFSQKGNLSEHERIHTGEKPFVCGQCNRRFTTSSQYRLHARRHQPEHASHLHVTTNRLGGRGGWAALRRREGRADAVKHVRRAHKKQVQKQISLLVSDKDQVMQQPLLLQQQHLLGQPANESELPDTDNIIVMNPMDVMDSPQVMQQPLLLQQQPLLGQPANESELPDTDNIIVMNPMDVMDSAQEPEPEAERVIYVTYNVDEPESTFHIMDPEQAAAIESGVVTSCSLYPRVLAPVTSPLPPPVTSPAPPPPRIQLADSGDSEHIAVTDEQGNPLHFTMSDGTRLAITSTDGKSLQVVTQDGQTIPVEINGYSEEEEAPSPPAILELDKDVEEAGSPVAHFFTIV